jgi:hypothetical protein
MAAPLLAAGIILYKHPPPVPLGPKYLIGLSHAAGLHVVIHGTVGAHPSSVARPAGETEVPEANGSGSAGPGNRRPAREASKHRRLTTDRRPLTPTVLLQDKGGGEEAMPPSTAGLISIDLPLATAVQRMKS